MFDRLLNVPLTSLNFYELGNSKNQLKKKIYQNDVATENKKMATVWKILKFTFSIEISKPKLSIF